MQDTAEEVRTNSLVMYSSGSLYTDDQRQKDQLELIYSSYVTIRDVALKTCPEAMDDREKWRERVRDIRANGVTWWWWWWWWWWYNYQGIYKRKSGRKCIVNDWSKVYLRFDEKKRYKHSFHSFHQKYQDYLRISLSLSLSLSFLLVTITSIFSLSLCHLFVFNFTCSSNLFFFWHFFVVFFPLFIWVMIPVANRVDI